jgi:hypothetical protein
VTELLADTTYATKEITSMISFELLDDEELTVLKKLIDPDRWDSVISEYGSEIQLERELGLLPHEFLEWKSFWLED